MPTVQQTALSNLIATLCTAAERAAPYIRDFAQGIGAQRCPTIDELINALDDDATRALYEKLAKRCTTDAQHAGDPGSP